MREGAARSKVPRELGGGLFSCVTSRDEASCQHHVGTKRSNGLRFPTSLDDGKASLRPSGQSVEINYTFQRMPSEATLASWVKQTHPGFTFALKAHQRISHWLRLKDDGEPTEMLLKALEPLREAGRLGPVLVQLPPNLAFDLERLEATCGCCPGTRGSPSSSATRHGSTTRSTHSCGSTTPPSASPSPSSSRCRTW